jgi:hypothetical protein
VARASPWWNETLGASSYAHRTNCSNRAPPGGPLPDGPASIPGNTYGGSVPSRSAAGVRIAGTPSMQRWPLARQAPFKERYKRDAESALITLKATGVLDDTNITCKVETYFGPALRQAAGGMPNSRLKARLKAASDS